MVKKIYNKISSLWLMILAPLIFIPLFFTILIIGGPAIERAFFPVVVDTTVTELSYINNLLTLDLYTTKKRECTVLQVNVQEERKDYWANVSILGRRKDKDKLINNPLGRLYLGTWDIQTTTGHVRATVTHKCSGLWDIQTPLFEYNVKD
ncbi:hypothetical protein [uncultured Paraglaciecola sp.]|uniref:hypothetical protein n=1 Tax=uncultured Paraglaciecola sp. TaxID=1765024 RepID=UPI00261D5321|nr:hypothetical protein [uncultured Paraglaciecola sp.]